MTTQALSATPILTPMPAIPVGEPSPTPTAAATEQPVATTPVATPPATTQAEAPTTPASPTPSIDAAPAPAAEPTPAVTTGNKTLDGVADFYQKAGLDPVEVANAVDADGSISIEAMQALIKEHGDSIAGLIVEQTKTAITKEKAAKAAHETQIHNEAANAFGLAETEGAVVWKQVQEWARSPEAGITDADRAAINQMLEAGGAQARFAIERLANALKASPQYVQPAKLEPGDGANPPGQFEPLSKQGYAEERRKLDREGHGDESQAVRALHQRRLKSAKAGY